MLVHRVFDRGLVSVGIERGHKHDQPSRQQYDKRSDSDQHFFENGNPPTLVANYQAPLQQIFRLDLELAQQ